MSQPSAPSAPQGSRIGEFEGGHAYYVILPDVTESSAKTYAYALKDYFDGRGLLGKDRPAVMISPHECIMVNADDVRELVEKHVGELQPDLTLSEDVVCFLTFAVINLARGLGRRYAQEGQLPAASR